MEQYVDVLEEEMPPTAVCLRLCLDVSARRPKSATRIRQMELKAKRSAATHKIHL